MHVSMLPAASSLRHQVMTCSTRLHSAGPPQLYGPDLGAELPPATGGGPGNMGGSFCGTIRGEAFFLSMMLFNTLLCTLTGLA